MSIISVKKVGGDYSTVDAALLAANHGDTVQVYPGTYVEQSVDTGEYNAGFVIGKNAITLEAVGAVTLMPLNPDTQIVLVKQSTTGYSTIRGFAITGLGGTGSGSGSQAVLMRPGHCTLERCTISNHPYTAVAPSQTDTVQYNHIHHCGTTTQHHGIYLGVELHGSPVFAFNDIHDITGAGIHLYNYEYDALIYANVCWKNGLWGIVITGENHRVIHNVCFGNQWGFECFHYGLKDYVIRNNVFWGNTGVDVLGDAAGYTNLVFDDNCFQTTSQEAVFGGKPGEIRTSPLFVTAPPPATWLDFRLQEASPCRGVGVSVAGVACGLDPDQADLASKAWPALRDYGAFVMSGTTPVVNLTHDLVTNRGGTIKGWFVEPGSFRTQKANDFTGRIATGAITHSEMDTWQVMESKDWSHGVGVEVLDPSGDAAMYLAQDGSIETALPKKIKLAPQWRVSDNGFVAYAYMDFGNFCFGGGTSSIRYFDPAAGGGAGAWAEAVAGLGAPVVGFEKYGNALYAALGDGTDMQKCVSAAAPTVWTAVTGKKARALKLWKKMLWSGYQGSVVSFDGTTWTTVAVGDPSTNVLGLCVHDGLLIVFKEEDIYSSGDGAAFTPVLGDIPQYSGNFKARSAFGWLYYNLLSSMERMSGLSGDATLQVITPKLYSDDTYGWGLPVAVASSSKYVWVLFDKAANSYPALLAYNQSGWHPAYLGTAGATAHAAYYSRVSGRLFINDGSTRARRYTTLNDEGYPDYDTSAGHTIDLLHLDASLADIVKAWKDLVVTTKNCSATKKIEISYQKDNDGTWALAGAVTASPQVTISLDAVNGAIPCKDLLVRATLYTDNAAVTPELTGLFLRYLPRPDTIYAISATLRLEEGKTYLDGSGLETATIPEMLAELRALADAKVPPIIDTMDDLQHKVFMTMVAWSDVEIVDKAA